MCEFNVGDEVVRYRENGGLPCLGDTTGVPPIGHVGKITKIGINKDGEVWFDIDNWPSDPRYALDPEEFRKVQRRDISQWLETATDYKEPKREKAKA